MITIFDYYWPVLVVALLIGIVSGVLAYRWAAPRKRG